MKPSWCALVPTDELNRPREDVVEELFVDAWLKLERDHERAMKSLEDADAATLRRQLLFFDPLTRKLEVVLEGELVLSKCLAVRRCRRRCEDDHADRPEAENAGNGELDGLAVRKAEGLVLVVVDERLHKRERCMSEPRVENRDTAARPNAELQPGAAGDPLPKRERRRKRIKRMKISKKISVKGVRALSLMLAVLSLSKLKCLPE